MNTVKDIPGVGQQLNNSLIQIYDVLDRTNYFYPIQKIAYDSYSDSIHYKDKTSWLRISRTVNSTSLNSTFQIFYGYKVLSTEFTLNPEINRKIYFLVSEVYKKMKLHV